MSRRSSVEPLRVLQEQAAQQRGNSKRSSAGSRMSYGRSSSVGRMSVGSQGPGHRRSLSSNQKTQGISRKSTSQAKQSIPKLTGRLSRGSGIGARGNVPKDPRPVSDKGYQHKNIKKVLQFLTDRGYPYKISPKELHSPLTKDFLKIFEFMYGHADPKYKVGPKPEEEIPRIFKLLGYPFMISKTSMFAIGSPHTWPHILAALGWLVEFVNYSVNIEEDTDKILFPCDDDDAFDSMSEAQIKFNYMEGCYKHFLDGFDTYEENDDFLLTMIKNRLPGFSGGGDILIEENQALEEELVMLEQDTDRLKRLEHQRNVLKTDSEKYQKYISELEGHRRQTEQQLVASEEGKTTAEAELESERAKLQKMQLIYDTQDFKPEDVERIKMRRRDMMSQIEELEKRCQSIDQDIWAEEMALTKSIEQIRSLFEKCNKIAYELKLIPITAENSGNIDFEMKPHYYEYLGSESTKTIKAALMTLKGNCAASLSNKEMELMNVKDQLEVTQEFSCELENDISILESKLKRATEELECKKEMHQKEMQRVQGEVDQLQSTLIRLQNTPLLTDQGIAKGKEEINHWFEREKGGKRQSMQECTDFIREVFQEVTSYKEDVDNELSRLVEFQERVRDKIKTDMEKDRKLWQTKLPNA